MSICSVNKDHDYANSQVTCFLGSIISGGFSITLVSRLKTFSSTTLLYRVGYMEGNKHLDFWSCCARYYKHLS